MLHRTAGGIRVVQTNGFAGKSIHEDSELLITNPVVSDQVVGLDGYMWRDGDTTQDDRHRPAATDRLIPSRLRIWDTLTMYEDGGSETNHYDNFIEIERNGKRLYYSFNMEYSGINYHLKNRVHNGVTDSEGNFVAKNLKPGIYYVTAQKGNKHSPVFPLTPVRHNRTIHLFPQIENNLQVYVIKNGFHNKQIMGIGSATVQLKGSHNRSLFTDKTDLAGQVLIKSLPWDTYELIVTPPEELHANPTSKTIEISAEYPWNRIVVGFDCHYGYTVSGVVLQYKTRQPVAGFPLRLMEGHGYPEYEHTVSDADGSFRFPNVIPKSYVLLHDTDSVNFIGFLPPLGAITTEDGTIVTSDIELEIVDRDIENIQYFVNPCVRTRFIGNVTDRDGKPVADAYVHTFPGDGGFVDSSNRTDTNGHFDLTLVLPESDDLYETTIQAYATESDFQQFSVGNYGLARGSSGGTGGRNLRLYYKGILIGQGETPIAYHAGDTVENIHIVLEYIQKEHAVVGTIRTENGTVPPFVEMMDVSFEQNTPDQDHISSRGTIGSDGSFRVDKVKSGPFTLEVSQGMFGSAMQILAESPIPVSYQREKLNLNMPEDQDTLTVDFILKQGSYLLGKVVDLDSYPVREAYVRVESEGEKEVVKTNQDGIFLITGLTPDKEYALEVAKEHIRGVTYIRMEGLRPPQKDILLQIDTRK